MSDTNVLTHARFATPERLKELEASGVVVIDQSRNLADLSLQEPQYGEEIIGTLEDDERALFFSLYDANLEVEDLTRTHMGNQIARVGKQIKESDRSKDLREALQEGEITFEDDDEAKAFFRLSKLRDMIHATFHFNIGERLSAHDYVLGVRTQGRIVKVSRRY
jgi:hypothetical protein